MSLDPAAAAALPGLARRVAALVVLATLLAALAAWAAQLARPLPLPEVSAARLPCVSYAPFRREGHTPFDATLVVTPEQIEADLRTLAQVTPCVRTYGLDHGIDAVPEIARKLGLRVVLGAWIGRDPVANRAQLDRALDLARSHGDVIDLLVIGNEVLLRREQTPEAMAALLREARAASPVPVAYADVWEFWLRHAEALKPHVDVVAAHILPYWEDHPVGVAGAAEHVHQIAGELRSAFAPLPVFVGETGWPAAGRQRGPAVAGSQEQSRFVREMLARQSTAPLAFNLIEAYDQPWKRRLEGAMGGHWGMFDAQGKLRVALVGPAPGDALGRAMLLAGACGAVFGSVLGLATRRSGAGRTARTLAWVLAAAGIAALLPLMLREIEDWSRDPVEWVSHMLMSGLALGAALIAAARLAALAGGAQPAPVLGAVQLWRASAAWSQRMSAALRLAYLFAMGVMALGLVFDPRYRPLGWWWLAAPAVLAALSAWLGGRSSREAREERLLAAACLVTAPLIAGQEGWANGQAQLTAALLAVLGLAVWTPFGPHAALPRGRTNTSAASSTAGAASHTE
jgi:glucan 1,3-beta-glucosidase